MAEIDTSSYPKPGPPVNLLDTVGKLQDIGLKQQQSQSNAIGIDQSKLKLVGEQYQIVNGLLGRLAAKPDLTPDDFIKESQGALQRGLSTPEQHAQFVSEIPTKTSLKYKYPRATPEQIDQLYNKVLHDHADSLIIKAQQIHDAVQSVYGAPGAIDNGQQVQPTRQPLRGPPLPTGAPIQKQLPPGFETATPQGQQAIGAQNPQLPPGANPVPGGMPGQFSPTPVKTVPVQSNRLPIAAPQATTAPSTGRVAEGFNDLQPRGPATSLAPGYKQAEDIAGQASGEQLAKARGQAANFQRDVFPLTQAIPALEKLGVKGTGPGTETINNLKSFILSNVPGVKESDFNGTVADYDKAKKYLTDFVNQTGNSGTNDKLAAAFAGNPSVHISNAAAVDVAKSALALRLMQQAQHMEFEKQNLPASAYSKWIAQKNNQLDPRAFGINYMSPEAKKKLFEQLNRNPKEGELFDKSLGIAHDAGYVVLGK